MSLPGHYQSLSCDQASVLQSPELDFSTTIAHQSCECVHFCLFLGTWNHLQLKMSDDKSGGCEMNVGPSIKTVVVVVALNVKSVPLELFDEHTLHFILSLCRCFDVALGASLLQSCTFSGVQPKQSPPQAFLLKRIVNFEYVLFLSCRLTQTS